MKRVLVALFLCLVFTSEVQAKKVMITFALAGDLVESVTADGCSYSIGQAYSAFAHVHKSNSVSLKVLVGDNVIFLDTTYIDRTKNIGTSVGGGTFNLNPGDEWSMVWVIESTKGKGNIIDAAEMASGICNL